jgi:hypothetical protein
MNFPPSQYQLHLQYFLPPFMPHQWQMIGPEGKGFLYGRFFPLEYVRAVLVAAAGGGNVDAIEHDTPIETLIEHFSARGVDYKATHARFVEIVAERQKMLGNWQPEDFTCRLQKGTMFDAITKAASQEDFGTVLAKDKSLLQNYGRPYTEPGGKPSGTFYKYPKTQRLEAW